MHTDDSSHPDSSPRLTQGGDAAPTAPNADAAPSNAEAAAMDAELRAAIGDATAPETPISKSDSASESATA
ncbi:MAG: hypothetical protein ACYSUU_01380, partial [Planctomycetota bacterium]